MGELGAGIPNTMKCFSSLHHSAGTGNGTMDGKVKELIALGIAIAIRCEGCIAFHTHDALKAGASEQEIMETIGVAILMGGGPSVMYGCEAFEDAVQNAAKGLELLRHLAPLSLTIRTDPSGSLKVVAALGVGAWSC